jgi:hypothetical protein
MTFDTSDEAARVQTEVLRRLGPARRIAIACEMSETVRELARARIRAAHPGLDPAGVRDVLIFELYGLRPNPR